MIFGLSLTLLIGVLALSWGYAWFGLRWAGPSAIENPRQLAAVDGLRGILALSVFVHHAVCTRQVYTTGVWNAAGDRVFTQAGTAAVTLFFFITGFLFWAKLQRQPHLPLAAHMRSRVLRLTPAYVAAIVVMLLLVGWHTAWQLNVTFGQLLATVVNWLTFALPGQSDVNGLKDTKLLMAGVVWTLRLEWGFYALIPFLGWFTYGLRRTALLLTLFLILDQILKLIGGGLPAGQSPRLLELGTAAVHHLARTFAGGIGVAALWPFVRTRWPRVDFGAAKFSVISASLVLGVLLLLPAEFSYTEVLLLLIPFGLIVLGNDWFGLLTSQPTLFLGRISYSVYLLHGLVLHVFFFAVNTVAPVASISTPAYWGLIAVVTAIVLVVAARWYRWFEAPFISNRRAPAEAPAG